MISKKHRFLEILSHFKDKNILVIGDVMIDEYIYGKVERISPEAPVPVVNFQKKEVRLGGAANVALNLLSLDSKVSILSVVGKDQSGSDIFDLLKSHNINSKYILPIENRPTTLKTRIIGNNAQLLRIDNETEFPISSIETNSLISLINKDIHLFDCIIFEDYDKGCITKELINSIVILAKEKNIPICVDPKRKNFLDYKGVTLFKPNLKELAEGLKMDSLAKKPIQEILETCVKLESMIDSEIILVTLSERGAFIKNKTNHFQVDAHLRNISDVSGAGDTVISVASLCLCSGANIEEILNISNLAGGMVCEKVGVVPLNFSELQKEISKVY